ncbi:MAG TPA: cupin domain-containing protein [Cyclobacteriaceae bacterium]|nr:cupin domain-containing protein [Cyclobacteriaceae bacterium]
MTERHNEATPQRPDGTRVLDAPLVDINLNDFIKIIKEEPTWKDSDKNSITVYKTDGLSVVLIALHRGAELKRHTAAGIITVQVLDGRIRFDTDEGSSEMGQGEMLALHERIPHAVFAMEESVFLLTHAKPKTA